MGLLGWLKGLRGRKGRDLMRATPIAAIDGAAGGRLVRITGKVVVERGELLVAPFSGRRVVTLATRVARFDVTSPSVGGLAGAAAARLGDDGSRGTWSPLVDEERICIWFTVDDGGTRPAQVNPAGAEVKGYWRSFDFTASTDVAPPELEVFMRARGREPRTDGSLRYEEHAILPGQTVHVLGLAHRSQDGRLTIAAGTLGDRPAPFIITNLPEEEWNEWE